MKVRTMGIGTMRKSILIFLMLLFLATPSLAVERLKLSTTTSTENSGLLYELLPPFEKQFNVKVDVISVGTGKALELGKNGDADVVLVHARNLVGMSCITTSSSSGPVPIRPG
jgi:tungstate transport system substrate-binding protein